MVVDAALLQTVSMLNVVVTMLSVWQEHTASVCDVIDVRGACDLF